MRLLLLSVAAVCLICATVCFGMLMVDAVQLITSSPELETGVTGVIEMRAWGMWFLGLAAAGSVILWLVPEDKRQNLTRA